MSVLLLDRNFRVNRPLGRWMRQTPLRFRYRVAAGNGTLGTRGVRISNTHVATDPQGERICIGDAIQPAVSCFMRDGTGMTITWSAPRKPLPPEEVRDRARAATGTTQPDFPMAEYRGFLERIALPPHMPFFDALHLDSDLNLWVRDSSAPAASGNFSYFVFGRDGKLRARAQIPFAIRNFQIFGSQMLTTQRDSLDVTYVVKLPIRVISEQ
jgi:hypothetical protein